MQYSAVRAATFRAVPAECRVRFAYDLRDLRTLSTRVARSEDRIFFGEIPLDQAPFPRTGTLD